MGTLAPAYIGFCIHSCIGEAQTCVWVHFQRYLQNPHLMGHQEKCRGAYIYLERRAHSHVSNEYSHTRITLDVVAYSATFRICLNSAVFE